MNDIIVTLKYQHERMWEEVDLALPTAVPFQQLAHILAEKLDIPELKALSETSSVSGRINDKLIIRPNETLEMVQAADGAFLELLVTRKSDREPGKGGNKGPHLRSVDTDAIFPCVGQFIRIGRTKRHAIALGGLPHGDVISDRNGHATILVRGQNYFIRDEGSTNGTLVDGVAVRRNQEMQLRDGARVQFGHEGPVLFFHLA